MADTAYISKVKLPGGSTTYYIKDEEARADIAKLQNATRFLGKTITPLSDGDTTTKVIDIGSDPSHITATYAVTPTTETQKQLQNGDIVIASGDAGDGSDEGTEYICALSGTNITWYKFGSAKLNELGDLAYKNSASTTVKIPYSFTSTNITYATGISSVTNPTITVTPSTANVNVSVPASTWVTGVSYSKTTGVKYSKTTGVSYSDVTSVVYDKTTGVELTSTAATGVTATIASNTVVVGVTGGTGTKNTASKSLALYSVTGGQKIVTDVSVADVTGGTVVVSSEDVYGLENSTTTYMTGPESINQNDLKNVPTSLTAISSGGLTYATVNDETLELYQIGLSGAVSVLGSSTTLTAGTSKTAKKYTVAKDSTYTITGASVSLTVTSDTYKVSVPKNTWIDSVTAAAGTLNSSAITLDVSGVKTYAVGNITYDSSATATVNKASAAADITHEETTTTDITLGKAGATLTKVAATALNLQVSTATGAFTVATGISSATATGTAVSLSTSGPQKVLTGVTTSTVYVS